MDKLLRAAFWSKDTGNIMSHQQGLTPEQIQEIKQLEVGDRLIMWLTTEKKNSSSPGYILKVYRPKGEAK